MIGRVLQTVAVAFAALAICGGVGLSLPARAAESPATVIPPAIDAIDVEPAGVVLLTGTAEPGASIAVMEGQSVVGTAVANAAGSFALALGTPLLPGKHELALRSTSADGSIQLIPDARIAVNVPPPTTAVSPAPTAGDEVTGSGPAAGPAAGPVASSPRQTSVTVQDGDTLWGIAAATLGDPSAWQDLYRANRDQLANPGRIYPGQVLKLPH